VQLPERGRGLEAEETGREVHRLMLMMASLGPGPGEAYVRREGSDGY